MSIRDRARLKAEKLARGIGNMIRRVRFLSSDDGLWQAEGVESAERWAGLEVFGNVGYVSRPKDSSDAELIVLQVGGASGHPVIVASRDRALELSLAEDETAIYNSSAIIHIKADGTIEARSRGGTAVELALKSDVQAIVDVLTGWTVAANDGGQALQTKAVADLASIPAGTTKLKGE